MPPVSIDVIPVLILGEIPTSYSVTPPKDLKGALESNFHLEGAERLLEGRVYGPECLIARNNEIYTGIHGGEVIKLTSNHVTHVTKIGQPCGAYFRVL